MIVLKLSGIQNIFSLEKEYNTNFEIMLFRFKIRGQKKAPTLDFF